MKLWSLIFTVALTISVSTANAQFLNSVDTVTGIDLTNTGVTPTITNISRSGVLTGISCKVTAAVTGTPGWLLSITVDGGSAKTLNGGLYGFANTWPTFCTVGNGSAVGDVFFVPLHVSFSTSLLITTGFLNGATTGTLTCSAFRN